MADAEAVNPFDLNKPTTPDSSSSNLVKGIVSANTPGNAETFLDAAPEVDLSLLKEVAPQDSMLLLGLKITLSVVSVLSVFSVIFFSSQLTDRFDFVRTVADFPSVTKDLVASNNEIVDLKTDLNFYKYLKAKAYFDEFSYFGDTYLQSYEILRSQTSEEAAKETARKNMEETKPAIAKAFMAAREQLIPDLEAKISNPKLVEGSSETLLFVNQLKNKFNEKATELSSNNEPEAVRQMKNYSQSAKIVGNGELRTTVLAADFNAMDDKQLYEFIKKINSLIVNDLSVMQKIKDKRIKWSDVMNEIQLRTIAVDKHYDEKLYQEIGGIRYTSYDFDGETSRISITGETKKTGTTNFSLIAELIDELNRSNLFGNASMNSFSKSGSLEEGYTANLKLDLDLKEE
ncbi:hypothetical protein COU74_00450 [Candidatus Peregrinibacteria bacterium CG10_big_fil_rev_8_21_14_0_10_36_19]|nr:MAG: hypothetical protein COU74_00450 [Candidatus Peregrinibacteria bacterium CG10_big_fil_rev_8_21_14_0_10_36_19]